uniref:Uncharacterized protein n=1 Tax=Trichobilharzia regenti TaxID=157069 RepID=A0AA85IXU8_TRIRE|nr:unnamed protein product [Trichobilharzia regenti]
MKQFSLIHGNQIEDIMFHNISFEDILFPWVEYDWLNGKFYFLRHNSVRFAYNYLHYVTLFT